MLFNEGISSTAGIHNDNVKARFLRRKTIFVKVSSIFTRQIHYVSDSGG